MGNAINGNNVELNKSEDRNLTYKQNIDEDIGPRQRATSLTPNKDNKVLRAQYFKKLNQAKEVEKQSMKISSPLSKEMDLTSSLNDKMTQLKSIN